MQFFIMLLLVLLLLELPTAPVAKLLSVFDSLSILLADGVAHQKVDLWMLFADCC